MSASEDQAGRFVNPDGSVRWADLGITAFVGLLLTWLSGIADFIFALFQGPRRAVAGAFDLLSNAVAFVFQSGRGLVDAGFSGALREFPVGLGPAEFVAGVAFVVAWLWVLTVALERLEVLG